MQTTVYRQPNYARDPNTQLSPCLLNLLEEDTSGEFENLAAAGQMLGDISRLHEPKIEARRDSMGFVERRVVARSIKMSSLIKSHAAGASVQVFKTARFLEKQGFISINSENDSGRPSYRFDLRLDIFSAPERIEERWYPIWSPVQATLTNRRLEKRVRLFESQQPWIVKERMSSYDAFGRFQEYRSGDVMDPRTAAYLSNSETPDPRIEPLGDRILIESPHQCRCKYCKCFTPADRPLFIAVDVIKLGLEQQKAIAGLDAQSEEPAGEQKLDVVVVEGAESSKVELVSTENHDDDSESDTSTEESIPLKKPSKAARKRRKAKSL